MAIALNKKTNNKVITVLKKSVQRYENCVLLYMSVFYIFARCIVNGEEETGEWRTITINSNTAYES